MEEQEIISKFEKIRLPHVETSIHRRLLKTALLSETCQHNRKGTVKVWFSQLPVWRIPLAGILTAVLIIGLVLAWPYITNQSQAAIAASIARNSPEVKAFFGEATPLQAEVIKVTDDKALVFVKGQGGDAVTVDVDLKSQVATIRSQPAGSYEQAGEKAGFTVGKPTYIPEGLVLEAVATIGDSSTPFVAVNSLYSDHPITGGWPTKSITLQQRSLSSAFIEEDPIAFVNAGFSQVEIQGEAASWKRGVTEQKSLNSTPYVNNGKIQIHWNSPSQQIGYIITGENVSFEELIKFANSIKLIK